MIRAVIDTNIFVSALISPRALAPQIIFQAVRARTLQLLTSIIAIEELEEVLNRPKIVKYHKLSAEQISEIIDELARVSELVSGEIVVIGVSDDPDDDTFLSIALEGRADAIISGDNHLLSLKTFRGIPIVTPNDFVGRFMN